VPLARVVCARQRRVFALLRSIEAKNSPQQPETIAFLMLAIRSRSDLWPTVLTRMGRGEGERMLWIRHVALVAAAIAVPICADMDPAFAAARRTATITDAELMHQAVHACRSLSRARRVDFDVSLFQRLLDLERELGVPEKFRGMTIAKACIESGYSAGSKGDCKDGSCKAVGIIQLWPWTQRFGVDRSDPIASVRFLLERVNLGLEGGRLVRICGKKRVRTDLDAYRLAWLRINRGPLDRGVQRCDGTPHGLRRLRQWQRNIARNHRAEPKAIAQAARAQRHTERIATAQALRAQKARNRHAAGHRAVTPRPGGAGGVQVPQR
jgi:hypothetical protein